MRPRQSTRQAHRTLLPILVAGVVVEHRDAEMIAGYLPAARVEPLATADRW